MITPVPRRGFGATASSRGQALDVLRGQALNAYLNVGLQGPPGPPGPPGPAGIGINILGTLADYAALLALPGPHADGDAWVVTAPDGDLYVWHSEPAPGAFTNVGRILGPQGPQGPPGGFATMSDNAPINAQQGDFWFDTNALKLYVRFSNTWVGI